MVKVRTAAQASQSGLFLHLRNSILVPEAPVPQKNADQSVDLFLPPDNF